MSFTFERFNQFGQVRAGIFFMSFYFTYSVSSFSGFKSRISQWKKKHQKKKSKKVIRTNINIINLRANRNKDKKSRIKKAKTKKKKNNGKDTSSDTLGRFHVKLLVHV